MVNHITTYWELVARHSLQLNESWDEGPDSFLKLFNAVPLEIGHLYAAHWCHSEVCNGGLYQFFYNTTGILAPEAIRGFTATGMPELAGIVAEGLMFFGDPYPRDREIRQQMLPPLGVGRREETDPFSHLDLSFYRWSDGWEDAANGYAEELISRGLPSQS